MKTISREAFILLARTQTDFCVLGKSTIDPHVQVYDNQVRDDSGYLKQFRLLDCEFCGKSFTIETIAVFTGTDYFHLLCYPRSIKITERSNRKDTEFFDNLIGYTI